MLGLEFTASRTQIASYLFGVALFSISFLVFLNSSISFVITQRMGYSIVGVALWILVQAKNVYPQLLFARVLFSLGGSAT
jgi:Na+/H+ antiporter NhaA